MATYAKLYDATKCIACRACQVACKQWNQNPAEKTEFFAGPGYQNPAWLDVNTFKLVRFFPEMRSGNKVIWPFHATACMHCTHPSCVPACPVEPKAMVQSPHGYTYVDKHSCVGCGSCVEACPYQVPHVDMDLGEDAKSMKCSMCVDRITNALEPACVTACPTGALDFGDRDEMLAKGHERARLTPGAHLYGATQMDGLHYLAVLRNYDEVGYDKGEYPLPKNPEPGEPTGVRALTYRKALKELTGGVYTAEAVGRVRRKLKKLSSQYKETKKIA